MMATYVMEGCSEAREEVLGRLLHCLHVRGRTSHSSRCSGYQPCQVLSGRGRVMECFCLVCVFLAYDCSLHSSSYESERHAVSSLRAQTFFYRRHKKGGAALRVSSPGYTWSPQACLMRCGGGEDASEQK